MVDLWLTLCITRAFLLSFPVPYSSWRWWKINLPYLDMLTFFLSLGFIQYFFSIPFHILYWLFSSPSLLYIVSGCSRAVLSNRLAICYISTWIESKDSNRCMYINVHTSIMHNSLKVETTQCPLTNEWLVNLVHIKNIIHP